MIRAGRKTYGYVRLWGMIAETALAVVDLLLDRDEASRAKPELAGWDAIEGLLLDVRGNSGGYDPNILTTFLRGQWSAGDYFVVTREGRRLSPPEYQAAAGRAARQLGHGERGRGARAEVPRHGIGPIVGEDDGRDALAAAPRRRGSRTARRSGCRAARSGTSTDAPTRAGASRPTSPSPTGRAAPGRKTPIVEAGIRALVGSAAGLRPATFSPCDASALSSSHDPAASTNGTPRRSSACATTAASRWPPTARSRSARPS